MTAKKTAILCLLIAGCAVIFIFYRIHIFKTRSILTGNSIHLIDRLAKEHIVQSRLEKPLRVIEREPLTSGWQKLARFNSVSIWSTFAQSRIAPGMNEKAPKLFLNLSPLSRARDLFHADVQPQHWDYYGNQIFLSLTNQHNPNNAHYSLSYRTYPDSGEMPVRGESVTDGQPYGFANRKLPDAVLFALAHPLIVRKRNPLSPTVIVKKNGKSLTAEDWAWYPDSEIVLYRSSTFGIVRLLRAKNTFESDQFLKGGLISFRIKARGEMAGKEFPKIALHLDNREIAVINITETEDRFYEVNTALREGHHRIKITFENDFFDPITHEDRNVDISEVSVHYKSAILIKDSRSRADKYTIDYTAASPEYYADFPEVLDQREPLNGIQEPPVGRISFREDLRSSLILSPSDQIDFPILVPPGAILKFSYAVQTPGMQDSCGCKIEVTVRRAIHFPSTVFSAAPQAVGQWKEATADLGSFAGQRIGLSFRLTSDSQTRPLSFIGNPIVLSATQQHESFRHIFWISFDALRADHLKVYGYGRDTSPNIDSFSKDSVIFDQAFTAATWTLPSFNSSFTSLNAAVHKVKEINQVLGPSRRTLTQILKSRGYLTAGFVDSPFLFPAYGLDRGFDFYDYAISDIRQRPASSLRWLDSFGSEKHFFFVHLISPHSPWEAPADRIRQVSGGRLPGIDKSRQQAFLAPNALCAPHTAEELEDVKLLYDGEIRELDEIFGQYIRRMKQLGIYDDALIIFSSDHGEEFQEHGALLHGSAVFQETGRVPLIIKFPKNYAHVQNLRINTPVQLIDLLPTILESIGAEAPSGIQGESLLPLLLPSSHRKFPERSLFIENEKGILGILNGKYKYIFSDVPAVRRSCRVLKPEELYDLSEDSGETHDIASSHPELLPFFRKERDAFFENAARLGRTAPGEKSSTVNLDPQVKEQIRALGYIQ